MRSLLILAGLLSNCNLLSQTPLQTVTLNVESTVDSTFYPSGYEMQINLMVQRDACDPTEILLTIEQQEKMLIDTLRAYGLDTLSFLRSYEVYPPYFRPYIITVSDEDELEKINDFLKRHRIQNNYENFIYKDFLLHYELNWLMRAYRQARIKAESIANHLGMRISGVLEIDENDNWNDEYFLDFETPTYESQLDFEYTLDVTFELTK